MTTETAWDLKNLVAWQVAMDFAAAVHLATRDFPDHERFGLRMQLRRAPYPYHRISLRDMVGLVRANMPVSF